MFDIFSMGDYTFYVWASVGIVLVSFTYVAMRAHQKFSALRQTLAWSKHAES